MKFAKNQLERRRREQISWKWVNDQRYELDQRSRWISVISSNSPLPYQPTSLRLLN